MIGAFYLTVVAAVATDLIVPNVRPAPMTDLEAVFWVGLGYAITRLSVARIKASRPCRQQTGQCDMNGECYRCGAWNGEMPSGRDCE